LCAAAFYLFIRVPSPTSSSCSFSNNARGAPRLQKAQPQFREHTFSASILQLELKKSIIVRPYASSSQQMSAKLGTKLAKKEGEKRESFTQQK